jgi:hypothetical protein
MMPALTIGPAIAAFDIYVGFDDTARGAIRRVNAVELFLASPLDPARHCRAGRMRSPAMPPSTASAVPVVALAAGDARWRIAAATSLAVTSRPSG